MSLIDKIDKADFKAILEKKGYVYFTKGIYNLNIIGVRKDIKASKDLYEDYIIVEYNDYSGTPQRHVYPATTFPGKYYLSHPLSFSGCAILVPGQYRGCWTIGLHRKSYEALVQIKPVKVYRDNNKDIYFDLKNTTIEEGVFGINIHRSVSKYYIGKSSAGCQVFKNVDDFDRFMNLAYLQFNYCGTNIFSYTLLDEKDL